MSRTATTPNGLLWEWNDNDNPGAGTKGVTKASGGTGLNSCWSTLDVAVGTEHNANGTHKNDKITGANLNANVVDGATLEVSAGTGTKVIRIKDAGVTMAKIAQAGATTGQAIVWSGSAWAPGSPIATLADGYVTRVKLHDDVKPIQSSHLFGDVKVAGTSPGNTPAAATEWTETSSTGVTKVAGFVRFRRNDRYIRLMGQAITSNATRAWRVELVLAGSVVLTVTGTNTSYNLATPFDLNHAYQVTTGADLTTGDYTYFEVRLSVVGGSATATLKNLTVTTDALPLPTN